MKKVFLFLLLVCLTFLLMGTVGYVTFHFFESKSFKNQLEELGEYKLEEDEKIIKKFSYGSRKYILSTVPYRKTNHFNISLYYKNKYYLLKTVPSCKILDKMENVYLKDNHIYVHCDGATGVVMDYTVVEGFIGEKEYVFDFLKTPNSDFHYMTFRKLDNKYFYLKTTKIDENVEEGEKIQCSLKTSRCYYEKVKDKKEKTSKK